MAITRRGFVLGAAASAAAALSHPTPAQAGRAPKERIPGALGMLIDTTLCIGCKGCQNACKRELGMPADSEGRDDAPESALYDMPKGLSHTTACVIKQSDAGDAASFVKQHCLHCVDPSCVSVCPVNAMIKDPVTGIVSNDPDRCIGCRYCVYACPFGVPQFDYVSAYGRIHKCEMCPERRAAGELPACCDACPTGATLFGPVEELMVEAQRRLNAKPGESLLYPRGDLSGRKQGHERPAPLYIPGVYGQRELGGTQVLYLAGQPFEQLGLPTDVPDVSYATVSEGIQHAIYKDMIAPTVIFGGLLALIHRRESHASDEEKRDDH
ncbi:hydrogenase 2 operon protein HybA [Magnetofaba australis]|uniref:Putative hydrogenase-2 operon protein hybA n=1 Tax=Magnetofaba australis IT-1 TaxID=1434232 RepID=A0A1Y2K508_9PROT|nr:hydrogenase 2 operon protein HybA [Magnetofaba australis]OSM04084.1 putative hydrogenase-2 operon protein hybA [Magnetofaba australis IT-1]